MVCCGVVWWCVGVFTGVLLHRCTLFVCREGHSIGAQFDVMMMMMEEEDNKMKIERKKKRLFTIVLKPSFFFYRCHVVFSTSQVGHRKIII